MSIFSKKIILDTDKEERRQRMEAHVRRLWGEEEIDLEELVHVNDESRKNELISLNDDQKVLGVPDGSEDFIVFIDRDLDLDYITDEPLGGERNALLAQISSTENHPYRHLPRSEILSFKRILGGAIICAIDNAPERARTQNELAQNYLKKRTTELSRQWTLRAGLIIMGFVLGLGIFIPDIFILEESKRILPVWAVGSYFGIFGAFLSIIQSSGRKELDSASGLTLHIIELFVRFFAGSISGLMIIYIAASPWSPEMFKGLVYVTAGPQVLGFLAGFSDKLIPSIVSKYQEV